MELIITKNNLYKKFYLLLLCVFFGCNSKNNLNRDLEIVKSVSTDLFNYRFDSLQKYCSKDLVVNLNNRQLTSDQWFSFLERNLIDEEMRGSMTDSIIYTTLLNNDIRVIYSKSDWATKCLKIPDFIHIDIYSLKEDRIVQIKRSVVNNELADSISFANQNIFFQWAKSNNYDSLFLGDGSINQYFFFPYLRLYCDSL